jgi:hypothetical protein
MLAAVIGSFFESQRPVFARGGRSFASALPVSRVQSVLDCTVFGADRTSAGATRKGFDRASVFVTLTLSLSLVPLFPAYTIHGERAG